MTEISPLTALPNSYFLTIRLSPRINDLFLQHISTLRAAMRHTLKHHPMRIDAMAVLPGIIHALWTLPDGDTDYPNRIGMLKSRFSRSMETPSHRSLAQIQRGEKGIWELRYWEHKIRNTADFARHRDLVHLSPVHAGLCATPQDWPHSSIHRDITRRIPPPLSLKRKRETPHEAPETQAALQLN